MKLNGYVLQNHKTGEFIAVCKKRDAIVNFNNLVVREVTLDIYNVGERL